MEITLQAGSFGWDFIIAAADGRTALVESDRDYPGLASTFGWSVTDSRGASGWDFCPHDGTDGTIDCGTCGRTVSAFINSASDFLAEHVGATVEDPGYFEGEATE